MLTPPAISDSLILACLQKSFGLQDVQLSFLPLGADINTAVYRASTSHNDRYFVKLRKGNFQEVSVSVPFYLAARGVPSLIPPLPTQNGTLWAKLGYFYVIVYPYIPGTNGYVQQPSAVQWVKFGKTLGSVHRSKLPPEISASIPCENYTPAYREQVKAFQVQAQEPSFRDPSAAHLAQFMRSQRERISQLVARADRLGKALKARELDFVLCHSDIHAGNLHLLSDHQLYLVDWDNPTFSPKERDLNLIGGCPTWNQPEWTAWFYQGYGDTAIDPMALAYYRCERVIQDIAAYCEQMFLSDEGGEDRERGVRFFKGQFEPGHEIELAMQTGIGLINL